jgi:CRISPR-associated protein Cas2
MGKTTTGETTFCIISYDISDDRRRTKVHAILSGFGAWTQYSLFECYLTSKELILLRARLAQVLRADDNVRLYALCHACRARVEAFGCSKQPQEPQVYIV